MNRLLQQIVLVVFAMAVCATAEDSTSIQLRYEVISYGELQSVNLHHVLIEELDSQGLKTRAYQYRLDRKTGDGTRDSSLLASGSAARSTRRYSSSRELLDSTMTPVTRAALAGITLAPTDQLEWIGGLSSAKYELKEQGRPSLFVWFAEAPPELANYQQLAQLESLSRSGSFLFFELFRAQVRALLLSGLEYPPGSGKIRDNLIVTRIDSGVRTQSLLARDNSFVVELKSVTAKK